MERFEVPTSTLHNSARLLWSFSERFHQRFADILVNQESPMDIILILL